MSNLGILSKSFKKKTCYIWGAIIITLLLGVFFFVLIMNLRLIGALRGLKSEKDAELKRKIDKERELIRKDFDEKYSSDLTSFGAMAKALEEEKNKTKEIKKRSEQIAQKRGKK